MRTCPACPPIASGVDCPPPGGSDGLHFASLSSWTEFRARRRSRWPRAPGTAPPGRSGLLSPYHSPFRVLRPSPPQTSLRAGGHLHPYSLEDDRHRGVRPAPGGACWPRWGEPPSAPNRADGGTGSGLSRPDRAGLERLPDPVHVLLVLATHGQQGKRRHQPGQAPRLELQVGAVAGPWPRVGDAALEPDAHAPGCGGGLPAVRAIEGHDLDGGGSAVDPLGAIAGADPDGSVGELLHVLHLGVPLQLAAQVAAVVEHVLWWSADHGIGAVGQGVHVLRFLSMPTDPEPGVLS